MFHRCKGIAAVVFLSCGGATMCYALSPEATAVLNYMKSCGNGKYIFGQQGTWVQQGENPDIDNSSNWVKKVYDATGKWPAYGCITYYLGHRDPNADNLGVQKMWDRGMIPGVWTMFPNPQTGGIDGPCDVSQIFSATSNSIKTNFYNSLDLMATQLQWLKDRNIPAVYNPCIELDQKWYNASGRDYAVKVYQTIHDYFTNTKGLDNLIWSFHTGSGGGAQGYYPGDAYVNTIGHSIYKIWGNPDLNLYDYAWAVDKKKNAGKVLWVAEMGIGSEGQPRDCFDALRKADTSYPEIAGWSWWSDESYFNVVGNLNGPAFAASSEVITLDELPNLKNGFTQPPQIDSKAVTTAYAGIAYSYHITASGSPTPTITASGLPSWLSFNASTATLTGTPNSEGTTGTITVTATNTQGNANQTFTITISKVSAAAITNIRYYPRSSWAARMNGGVFEGTNGDPATGQYTTFYTITSSPTDGQWTEVTSLAGMNGFRYVRYRASGFCNVAEIEFYRGTQKVSGTVFGTPGSWGNAGNDYTKAFDGNTTTYMDFTTDAGGYTGMDLQSGATASGGWPSITGAGAQAIRILPHYRIAIPAGRFSLRVVNAAGAVVLQQSGIGPRTCDLSLVGKGMHVVVLASRGATVSRTFLNVK